MGPYSTTSDKSAASASASATVEETSSTRSFFSRFSLPSLRSRNRNVADFHIRPADPHRKYNAGDHVQGAVILTAVKPVRITHLTVALHGYVRVYKGPTSAEPTVNPAEIPSVTSRATRQKLYHGHASLFQDEQVLSSDGRLEPGRYEFNFDLLFPAKGLPSSIDFERGTISYMITATLTRPTTISPVTSCERKIYLVDKVDIGILTPPRPRTITLEPISKRSKKKRQPGAERNSVTSDHVEPISDLDSTRANENSTDGSLSVVGDDVGQDPLSNNPRSPVQSDVRSTSGDSADSASTGRSRCGDVIHAGASGSSLVGRRMPGMEDRTITATIELLKAGCLPGDTVPVKISVQHIRRIKSMHGVIVTLYRQGRIDSSPASALSREQLSKEEAKRLEKEEYYPKSKTGLGGLSLSAAGSCSVFRKDLSQNFTPLIIDPATLTATLTTSVRLPEDAFPTIKGVPGEMITFKYQLEVIVDLGGKLASQLQGTKVPGTRVTTPGAPVGMTGSPYEGGAASLPSWGTSIIDTDRLRRQKGVIYVTFEVIVGTMDTTRSRGKGHYVKPLPPLIQTQSLPDPIPSYNGSGNPAEKGGPWPGNDYATGIGDVPPSGHGISPQDYAAPIPYQPPPPPITPPQQYPYWNPPSNPVQHQHQAAAPQYVPPPALQDESNLSEKERIRRAEQRLLPSQPPSGPAAPSPLQEPVAVTGSPSRFLNGENIYDAEDDVDAGHHQQLRLPTTPSHQIHPQMGSLPPPISDLTPDELPSAPTLEELSQLPLAATEDKQELERRRLLAEASAPPEFLPEDAEASSSSAPPPQLHMSTMYEPSAPVFLEEEERVGVGEEDESYAYGANYTYSSVTSRHQGRLSSHSHGHIHGQHGHAHSTAADGSASGGDVTPVRDRDHEPEPLPKYER